MGSVFIVQGAKSRLIFPPMSDDAERRIDEMINGELEKEETGQVLIYPLFNQLMLSEGNGSLTG